MASLVGFFFPLPAPRRTLGAVVQWWEERRLAYNLIVGAAGCATVASVTILTMLVGGRIPPRVIVIGPLVYGVLANLCYTLGPMAELTLDRFLGERGPRTGPVLFRQGLIFSVGLTLFPIALGGLNAGARIFAFLLFR